MSEISYTLGSVKTIEQLFPPAKYANSNLGLADLESVIKHYTSSSLNADGVPGAVCDVVRRDEKFIVTIKAAASKRHLASFSRRHRRLYGSTAAGKAVAGKKLLEKLNIWNPMAGYHVNRNPGDGECKWHLYPPLGLNVMSQASIMVMHYPPWAELQAANAIDSMTMNRWSTLLMASGVPEGELSFYRTVVDVNPIAAPGSGQSEYPNDYLPIMMASGFFDMPDRKSYIRSMIDFYVNGPKAKGKKYTLPLIICGSPLYDPQAPGWFRAAYTDILPQDEHGIPLVDVLQAGTFKLFPDSERETPYMIANHMIAAGVTGRCTTNPGEMPDIRKYEAQDLVAATFLRAFHEDPDVDPELVKRNACERWFGNADGMGEAKPPVSKDAQVICAMAQMDLFFEHGPPPHPKYTFEEAMERCGTNGNCPCAPPIGPPSAKFYKPK